MLVDAELAFMLHRLILNGESLPEPTLSRRAKAPPEGVGRTPPVPR